jgi:hypothetical protein
LRTAVASAFSKCVRIEAMPHSKEQWDPLISRKPLPLAERACALTIRSRKQCRCENSFSIILKQTAPVSYSKT